MEKAPKSLRLQIGLFGRSNVGKSSFLNLIAGQDVSITSPVPGTTTDVVEKNMELLPIGPVVFLDTGGRNDDSELGSLRDKKSARVFDRADIFVLLTEAGVWDHIEDEICREAGQRGTPVIVVVNKSDIKMPENVFLEKIKAISSKVMVCSSIDQRNRDAYLNAFKGLLVETSPEEMLNTPPIAGDLIPANGLVIMVAPIDLQAPKGRLKFLQTQTIRDILDHQSSSLVVKETEYASILGRLKVAPDLVVCDSQVVERVASETPEHVPLTTFSILFSRFKGDLLEMARGLAHIEDLKSGDKVLMAEACTHHAIQGDLGRVRIPEWLQSYTGADLHFDVSSGRDYPERLDQYKLIIHCGSCMLTRKETLMRIHGAKMGKVNITNYGLCISFLKGVVERTLEPFPQALRAFEEELALCREEQSCGDFANEC